MFSDFVWITSLDNRNKRFDYKRFNLYLSVNLAFEVIYRFSISDICTSAKSERLDIGFIAQPVKTRIRIKARIHDHVLAFLIKRSFPDCRIRLIAKFSFFSFFGQDRI